MRSVLGVVGVLGVVAAALTGDPVQAEGTPAPVVVDVTVATGNDDAEEAGGAVNRTSTDLELVTDGAATQTVAVRFEAVGVPQGATVTAAWVQFTADEVQADPTDLVIRAHDSDNAPRPGPNTTNLTGRNPTAASVAWSPPAWDAVDEAGPDQRTPDLSTVVQEVVDRPAWWTGSALALVVTGSGHRTAAARDRGEAVAPRLHVEYLPPSGPPPIPAVTRLGVVGDFGNGSGAAGRVASLVGSLDVEAVLTVGDNSYGSGAIDENIGRHYAPWIGEYSGAYGTGAERNRFFPAMGNHDHTDGGGLAAYQGYFTLPGAGVAGSGTTTHERYYDVVLGPVHAFFLDSDPAEPDGITAGSVQAQWLQERLAASTSPWQVVLLHHPPYSSSGGHGSTTATQWPFAAWGADLVLAGHDHSYERLAVDGIPYVVNGLGGVSRYGFGTPLPQSVVRYVDDEGALLLEACPGRLDLSFRTVSGPVVDQLSLGGPTCGTTIRTGRTLVRRAGTVVRGSLASTRVADGRHLILREEVGPGGVSRADVRVTFDVPANDGLRVLVDAHRTASADGDRLLVEWSAGGPFLPLVTVRRTTDGDRPQMAALPDGLSGPVVLRVRDSDRTPGHAHRDTLRVDRLALEATLPG